MRTWEQLGLPSFDDGGYREQIRARARALNSDGCSGPTLPIYVDT